MASVFPSFSWIPPCDRRFEQLMIGESWAGPSAPNGNGNGNIAHPSKVHVEPNHVDESTDAGENGGPGGEMMWDIMWSGWVKELPEPSLMHHM